MSEKSSRTIKLFCPSLSKLVPLVALEEQRLDLGSIARTFGLDPATVKLNGHFISRGVDLISSSVTWKSLLSFFSARGLSTGTNDADALIVDGKLCKAGTKRAHNPSDGENGNHQTNENNVLGIKRKLHLEDVNLLKKTKMNKGNPGDADEGHLSTECNVLGVKRKPLLEDFNLLKRTKMNQSNSDFHQRQPNLPDTDSSTQFTCSYISGNMKRRREDDMTMTTPCKRAR